MYLRSIRSRAWEESGPSEFNSRVGSGPKKNFAGTVHAPSELCHAYGRYWHTVSFDLRCQNAQDKI